MKINLAQMKFNLAQMKFNLAQMKINVAEMKINVAEMKFNLAEMKFNLTLIKLISYFLLAIFIFWYIVKPWFTNISEFEQFGFQTEICARPVGMGLP